MLPGYYVSFSDNQFLTYGANGFALTTDTLTEGATFAAGINAGTDRVLVNASTILSDSPTLYSLRLSGGAFNISNSFGQLNTITFKEAANGDMGGLIVAGNSTIASNLKFGVASNMEALIYAASGVTATVTGDITAANVTKFGTGTLAIGKDQTTAARGTGNGFSGNWNVNQGSLTFSTFGGAGDGGIVTLYGSSTSSGAGSTLNLNATTGSILVGQYTMGGIKAVDNALVNIDPQANDRTTGIGNVEINSTDTTGLSPARLRFVINRDRVMVNAGTLSLTGTGGSILDVALGANSSNGLFTAGNSTGISFTGLTGSQNLTKWGNAYAYIGGNNTGFTGNVSIEQGALAVTNAGALGSGTIAVHQYGVLDIMTTGFTKAPTYDAGSIERWSVANARTGAINLGGATLQVNADQFTTSATVTLNGGSIEGFLRTDDNNSANSGTVFRTLGSGVSVVLAGNSFLGQNYYTDGPNGTDNGRAAVNTPGQGQPDLNNSNPIDNTARGVILEIKGNISGAGFGLTKQGSDTVILSGANTYTGPTSVTMGTLRAGSDTAFQGTGSLNTAGTGVLDLNNHNASFTDLNTSATGGSGSSAFGFITNSSTVIKTLTVNDTQNNTYGGVIQNNVALIKSGAFNLTLTNTNTYLGNTAVNGGTLTLAANGSINDSPWLSLAANTTLDTTAKSTTGYLYDGVITGGGVGATHATINGNLTVTDHVGDVSSIGSIAPGSYTSSALSSTGAQIGHVWVNGNLTLSGGLAGSSSPVNRASFQLNGATTNLSTLGYTGGDISAFIATLTNTGSGLTALQSQYIDGNVTGFGPNLGTLTNHDYINVGGTLTLNANGQISVTDFTGFTPVAGDVYNLFDWAALTNNSFNAVASGGDLNLPTLSAGMTWNTSQFLTHGILIVTPEPSRVLLVLFGILGLGLRRRRSRW